MPYFIDIPVQVTTTKNTSKLTGKFGETIQHRFNDSRFRQKSHIFVFLSRHGVKLPYGIHINGNARILDGAIFTNRKLKPNPESNSYIRIVIEKKATLLEVE